MAIRSQAIRKSAEGENCLVWSPHCNHDSSTTVLGHADDLVAGKGMGHKADDIHSFYTCSGCHDFIHAHPEQAKPYVFNAILRTQRLLVEKGLIKVVK